LILNSSAAERLFQLRSSGYARIYEDYKVTTYLENLEIREKLWNSKMA